MRAATFGHAGSTESVARERISLDDARMYLRTHTRDAHSRLDGHPGMAALVDSNAPPREIWYALVGMLTAHRRLARACNATHLFSSVPSEWFNGRAISQLQFDIDRYARSPFDTDTCVANVPFATLEAQLGVAYVVAGSSLGSKRIAENLRRHPDPWVASLTYFDAMAAAAPQFAVLIEALRANLVNTNQMQRATESANFAFDCFARAMDDVWNVSKNMGMQ
jgi:heme oxygenase